MYTHQNNFRKQIKTFYTVLQYYYHCTAMYIMSTVVLSGMWCFSVWGRLVQWWVLMRTMTLWSPIPVETGKRSTLFPVRKDKSQ